MTLQARRGVASVVHGDRREGPDGRGTALRWIGSVTANISGFVGKPLALAAETAVVGAAGAGVLGGDPDRCVAVSGGVVPAAGAA